MPSTCWHIFDRQGIKGGRQRQSKRLSPRPLKLDDSDIEMEQRKFLVKFLNGAARYVVPEEELSREGGNGVVTGFFVETWG